jgi:hypothetical protein
MITLLMELRANGNGRHLEMYVTQENCYHQNFATLKQIERTLLYKPSDHQIYYSIYYS